MSISTATVFSFHLLEAPQKTTVRLSLSPATALPLHPSKKKQIESSGFAFSFTRNPERLINLERRDLSFRCNARQLPDLAPAATAAYGALLLGGGLFAFARSGSKGSILGGLTAASLMSGAFYFMQAAETKPAGEAIAFGAAFLFSAVFGIRLAATRKVLPSGVLLAISLGSMTFFASAYLQDKI